jgi:hypothetical protein
LFENEKVLDTSLLLFKSMVNHLKSKDKPSTIEEKHVEDQSSTQSMSDCETSLAYLSPAISSLSLICCELSKSIRMSGWIEKLATTGNSDLSRNRLSTVMNMFHVHCRLVLSSLRYILLTLKTILALLFIYLHMFDSSCYICDY